MSYITELSKKQTKIDHTAMFVTDLEVSRAFYEKYFGAKANKLYHNPKTGLRTYFLSFDGDVRLEIMSRPDCRNVEKSDLLMGLAHLAFSVGSHERVDMLTAQLEDDGYAVISRPRTTGDGYYESVVLDADGNRIEITA